MRRLPPLHALRAFEAAARHLHFASAAEELGLTPTAISHQVRLLEDTLGVKLFRRTPRPISLSPEGARLFPVLRDALDGIAGAVDTISGIPPERPLSISVTVAFASRWLLTRLHALQHDTGLTVTLEADDRPVDLHGAQVDIAIRYAQHPGDGGQWHRLFSDRIIPVCAPELARGIQAPMTPRQIAERPLIHYRWKSPSKNAPQWERWFAQAHLAHPPHGPIQQFSEEIHALEAAIAGQGVVLAPERLVCDHLASGRLIALSDISIPGLTYWAVFLQNHPRRGDLMRLVKWFMEQAEGDLC